MTDVAAAEVPAQPAPPVLPPPDAEVEIGAPVAVAAAPAEKVDQAAPEGEASVAAPELAYPNGSVSELIVDHMIDSEGDQSIAQIIAGLGGTVSRNTVESGVFRLHQKGRLLRISPGVYRLGPEKPAEAPKPAPQPEPEPVRSDGHTTEEWFAALEAYFQNTTNWNPERFGPPPDERPNRIPPHVAMRFNDRLRKREERRRDREAAATRQAEADRQLRDRLVAGCFGNVNLGAGIQDMSPVRAMLADGIPLEDVLIGLKRVVDRRIEPRAAPISSWREPRFLESVARTALLRGLLPRLVDAWSKAPAKAVERAEASAATPAPVASESAATVPLENHHTAMPPSTLMSTPVTNELSSDARNSATLATSSGLPSRPSRVFPSM